MQAEVSHATAQVRVWCGGFTGEFLFRDVGELVGKGVSVRHGGPAFILDNWHGGGWFRGLGCSLRGSIHCVLIGDHRPGYRIER